MHSIVPRLLCIYGTCRARNLCKSQHCVGAALKEDGYVIEDGEIKEEKHALDRPSVADVQRL